MDRNGERQQTAERLSSFDLMASVDMMRFDIQRFGQILPETRQRVYDEELSSMAEGVDRAARTAFTLQRQGDELMYFDSGEWRPYMGMLYTGLEVAKGEAETDPRRQFLLDWAVRDQRQGYLMRSLEPGEQIVWHNAYPAEIEQRYGQKFLQDCGLFPNRQMGFIYRASCDSDGNVTLESQTVDNSDPEAFAAVQQLAIDNPGADMDSLVEAYDSTLEEKYDTTFYAGRSNAEINENAWNEIVRHRDLISYFLGQLETLAASNLPRAELEKQVKRHIIGSWKAFKSRLDRKMQPLVPELNGPLDTVHPVGHIAAAQERLALEVQASFESAIRSGEVKVGCGGSLSARFDDDLNMLDPKATFDAIFGEKLTPEETGESKFDEDDYGPLEFKCTSGCKNRRPRGKLITECKNKKHGCKGSVGC